MKVTFPAMKGEIGKRQYFSTVLALSEVPHLFKFNDWEQQTPELRAQRVLNKSRVPEITRYILNNENGYLFSSITVSYRSQVNFRPIGDDGNIGYIEMELENLEFVINDGQHRCAAIAAALKENPAIGKEKISVLLFPEENLDRLQQMFSDLNRFVQRTSKSLNVLYDHRDEIAALTSKVCETVPMFKGMVDKERLTIPVRSSKLFTLSTMYDANLELVGKSIGKSGSPEFKKAVDLAVCYWIELAKVVDDWRLAKAGDIKAHQLRQEKINTHAVVLRALGGLGKELIETYPEQWKSKLVGLKKIDWRKSVGNGVNPLWENVCITAGSVVSNRQARAATLEVLKKEMGLAK